MITKNTKMSTARRISQMTFINTDDEDADVAAADDISHSRCTAAHAVVHGILTNDPVVSWTIESAGASMLDLSIKFTAIRRYTSSHSMKTG